MALDQTYLSVSDGTGDASLMTVTAARTVGATVIDVDTVVGVPAKFIATSGTLASTGFLDPTTVTNFYGYVSGGTLVIDGFCPGSTDTGNAIGQKIAIKPNTEWANLVADIVDVASTAWTSFTPISILALGGGAVLTPLTVTGFYKQVGKTVNYRLYVGGTFSGTVNGFSYNLPVPAKDTNFAPAYGEIIDNVGTYALSSSAASTTIAVINVYDRHALTPGFAFSVSGTYESAY